MTNKPILPSQTPRPTSAPSRHLHLLGWGSPTQVGPSKEATLRLRSGGEARLAKNRKKNGKL